MTALKRLRNLGQSGFHHVFMPLVLFVLLFGVTGTYFLLTSHAAAAVYDFQLGYDRGLCLDNSGGKAGARNPIVQLSCNTKTVSEQFSLSSIGSNRFLLKDSAGTCVDDTGDRVTSSGNTVRLMTWACNSSDHAQVWMWSGSGGYHELKNAYNNGCINDPGYSKVIGKQMIVYNCVNMSNEHWYQVAAQKPVSQSPAPSPAPAPSPTPTPTPTPTPSSGSPVPNGISGTWNMKFDDEFNGTSLNTKVWAPSWFNGGKVNNSNGVAMNAANVSENGGNLILTLASSSSGATIDTDPSQVSGGYTFGTGYATEARIYIPGNGSTVYNWPAFWTDGQNWPTTGESDILEGLGTATSNYHSPQGASNSGTIPGTWANGWHTYALDREAGKDYIYWDGKLVRSYASDDGGAPQYLIFSLDCSGGCTTGTASQVKVDYVRVWQKG